MATKDMLKKVITLNARKGVVITPQDTTLLSDAEGGVSLFNSDSLTGFNGVLSIGEVHFQSETPDPSRIYVNGTHIVSGSETQIKSTGDLTISPFAKGTYTGEGLKQVYILGQDDNTAFIPGGVTIRGGSMVSNGFSGASAGAVTIEGGKANGGLQGSATWGGAVSLTAYGYGQVAIEGDGVALDAYSEGIRLSTKISGDSVLSGDITLSTGYSASSGESSGDISITTGETFNGVVGSVFISTGVTSQGVSGDVEIFTADLDAEFITTGDVLISSGDNSIGEAGNVRITAGQSPVSDGSGSVYVDGGIGSGGDGGGAIFITGGGVTGNVSDNCTGGGVFIRGGDIDPSNVQDPGETYIGGHVNLTGGYVLNGEPQNLRGNVNLNGNNVNISTEGVTDVSSTTLKFSTATEDRRLPLIGADGILSILGVSVLGSGKFTFTIPAQSFIYQIPMFMGDLTINDGVQQQAVGYDAGNNLIYPTIVETYTGYGPVAPAYSNYSPKIFFALRALSNGAFIEYPGTPIATDSFFLLNGFYVNMISFASRALNHSTDGIKNLGNTDADFEVSYFVLG